MPFETEVRKLLDKQFPCCALSNIPVFRPDVPEERMRGYEIDHLLHIRTDVSDRVIIVECKDKPVFGAWPNLPPTDEGPWNVPFNDAPPRDIKRAQLRNHAHALLSYLHDHPRPVLIEAWLVSSRDTTVTCADTRGRRIHYRLLGLTAFARELVRTQNEQNVLRVEQSALLAELRKGVPVRDMGHPELNNAIAYVSRCRNSIDMELFNLFDPRPQRWAINGTAGMGKTVLLAYALFVFASDRRVSIGQDRRESTRTLLDFAEQGERLGLPAHRDRVIHVTARKEKQLTVLEDYWSRFVREYSTLESMGLRFQKPVFRRWDGSIDPDCNVLLIDEAHDLDATGQRTVAEWLNLPGTNRYLAIACDRHQKLRLVGTDAPLIEGLNFSNQTRKLRRNYRNPFPVYAAGLGLMFRWFSDGGAKAIPSRTQLEQEFGFEVENYSDNPGCRISLTNWNDSHPGNYWSFTVSTFPSCEDAYAQLANASLSKNDVLWIRFGEEEEAFDYENLQRFTYHNCYTAESLNLVDKYVKGQEFPIVVIEGIPPDSDLSIFEGDEREKAMWTARRELYLCCSRCTCFLYFVIPTFGEARGAPTIYKEIKEMIRQVSRPTNPDDVTKRTWKLGFDRTQINRRVDEFLYDAIHQAPLVEQLGVVELERPITVQKLARGLQLEPSKLVEDLFGLDFTFKSSRDTVPDAIVREVCLRRGAVLTIQDSPAFEPVRQLPEADFVPGRVTSAHILDPVVPRPVGDGSVQPWEVGSPQSAEQVVQVSAPPPSVKESVGASDPNVALMTFLFSPQFPRFRAAVDQYLAILAFVAEFHPRGRNCILEFQRGRRCYFATSIAEIERRAASPNAKPIGKTGIYALTTTPTVAKRSIVSEILRCCGYGLVTREKAAQSIIS